MGFNSLIGVLNDRLSEIERDPEGFVREMIKGIHKLSISSDGPIDFHPGQSTVISCAHADQVTVVAHGGNHSTVLGRVYNGGNHHTEEYQIDLLERIADDYGFRLVRKSKKG
jgi:hypothetical protein